MGYCLSAYVVPYARLIALPGSGDRAALAEVLADAGDWLAEIDEERSGALDEGDETPNFSVAGALEDLFTGQWRCPEDGSAYGLALEALCCFLGERLPDGEFLGNTHPDWFGGIDAWLESERVPLRFSDLIYREPVALPAINDGPWVGHWAPEEVREAAPAVDRLLRGREEDGFVRGLRQAREWIAEALAVPGHCLVGVYG
jgi:hypothetical protein